MRAHNQNGGMAVFIVQSSCGYVATITSPFLYLFILLYFFCLLKFQSKRGLDNSARSGRQVLCFARISNRFLLGRKLVTCCLGFLWLGGLRILSCFDLCSVSPNFTSSLSRQCIRTWLIADFSDGSRLPCVRTRVQHRETFCLGVNASSCAGRTELSDVAVSFPDAP